MRSELCLQKSRSIFSLIVQIEDEEERLTLEVCRDTRQLKELRGRYNKRPSEQAWSCFEEWTNEWEYFVA
jgi:hypothetical protein